MTVTGVYRGPPAWMKNVAWPAALVSPLTVQSSIGHTRSVSLQRDSCTKEPAIGWLATSRTVTWNGTSPRGQGNRQKSTDEFTGLGTAAETTPAETMVPRQTKRNARNFMTPPMQRRGWWERRAAPDAASGRLACVA